MAKISDDGLRLTLDESERARVERELLESAGILARPRAGFARRTCSAGDHPLGTQDGCADCERHQAGARVRKI